MKKIILACSLLLSISYAGAATSCTDITVNLFRYQESPNVLAVQNFLFSKGFLKATPNGYFGNQTLAAVKLYQQSKGLSPVGSTGPLTRAFIKKESCEETPSSNNSNIASTSVGTSSAQSISQNTLSYPTYPDTQSGIRNIKRREDIKAILLALYVRYVDSRGAQISSVGDTPIDLCINLKPLETEFASTTGGDLLITKDSPCSGFVDVSYLSRFMTQIPHDPTLTGADNLLGYTLTRSEYNDITIQAKNAEDGEIIKVTCNFNGYCKNIRYITSLIYKKPEITALSRSTFLINSITSTPVTITGSNFTQKNTVKLYSGLTLQDRVLGVFDSTEISTTTRVITLENDIFNKGFPCMYGNCSEKIPLGDYMISVTNEGGISNSFRFLIKGFTTSTINTHGDSTMLPTTKNVKVATIALSSSYTLSLNGLTLTSTSTSANLPSKLSNFILKDALTGEVYNGGSLGSFGFSGVNLYANQSKIYDLYLDSAEVEIQDSGFITYGGNLKVSDPATGAQMEVPIKPFSFTVSH